MAKSLLMQAATEMDREAKLPGSRPSDFPIGTVLVCRFKGETHTVFVVSAGKKKRTKAARRRGWWRYVYRGDRYRTLTDIAYQITGDPKASGPRLFGLVPRKRGSRKRQEGGL